MKKLFTALLLSLLFISAAAQNEIRVEVPNIVAVDEQFTVAFIIEGEESPSDFKWNPGDEFKLVWGPQRGTSTSISIVNGKRTKSAQTTYTYILLPKSAGVFGIPPASATVKGKDITSQMTKIEVVKGGSGSSSSSGGQSSGAGQQSQQQPSSTGDIPSSDLFLRLTTSRSSVVVGEPLTVTLKLYQRVNIAGFEDAKFPTFNGFWSQEVAAPTNIEFHRENIDDSIFNAAVLRSWVLIPQQAGDIFIDPAELVCLVNVRTQSSSRSIFDSFFDDEFRTIRKRVLSDRLKIKVSRLPEGAPASFSGGVGTFSMNARLSKDSLKTHDASSLVITVSGKGNVSLLEAPKVSFPPDFDVYDVKVTENTDKSTGKTSGSKTFEYPFIPRSHGDFAVEGVEYSYYDVNQHKYVTLTTPSMTIKVERGPESGQPVSIEGQPLTSGVAHKDVKSLGSDIRYISTKKPSWSKVGGMFCFSPLFWVLLALLLLAAAAVYYVIRTVTARRSDIVLTKNKAATKMARRRLAAAGSHLEHNLYSAFYEELHKALLGYVSDKLNIDMSDMSRDNIGASLASAGVPDSYVSEFSGLLEACEFARYSPDAGHDAMDAHYRTALDVIASIDGIMKKKSVPRHGAAIMLALVLLPFSGRAADSVADSLWLEGVRAYDAQEWTRAADAWLMIRDSGLESPQLYCNIGDAYFKQKDIARAILYYERALKLDPSFADAAFNLGYAGEFVQDKIEKVPEFFLKTWIREVGHSLSSDTWTVLFFLLLASGLAMLLVFLLSAASKTRKVGFYSALSLVVLALLCLSLAGVQRSEYGRDDEAVVMAAVSSVKSSPGDASTKDLFILHEGTKVKVLDKVGDWSNIELSDGRQGWIHASDLELI